MAQRLCSCLQRRYWQAGKMPRLNRKLHTRQLIVAVLTLLWIQINSHWPIMILLTGITQPYLAVTGYDEGRFNYIGNLNFLSLDGKRWATPITGRYSRFSSVDYHYRYDQCTIKPIIFWGAQLSGPVSSTKLKPTNISTLYLSVRYLGYNIKTSKIKFLGPFEDFTKIVSPKNYRLYMLWYITLLPAFIFNHIH